MPIPEGTSKLEAVKYLLLSGDTNKTLYSWRALVAILLSFYGYYTTQISTQQTKIVAEQQNIKALIVTNNPSITN